MTPTSVPTSIRTLGDVLSFMAPFAGGSVPDSGDQEYTDWVSWIQNKQEEFARRGFWRRCLVREEVTLRPGSTHLLPDRLNKPNGVYMLIVDEVDWNEAGNTYGQTIFVEMINDPEDEDFAKWQMRFGVEVEEEVDAILWYFANPPVPTGTDDILILPGDMIGYAALSEYFRQANQEGSQDKAEEDAENRFSEYLSLEVLPAKNELLTNAENPVKKVDRLAKAKSHYTSRPGRNH